MNRKSLVYGLAAGVLAALVVLYLRLPYAKHGQSDDVAQLPASMPAQATPPAAGRQPEVANSTRVVPDPHSAESRPQASPSPDTFAFKAARYAERFQAGVFYDEGMPEFALSHFFPTEGAMTAALAEYAKVEQTSVDAWSDGMTSRLRTFFSEQADLSNAHISIGCHASECQLQVVEMTASEDPPRMADRRMQILVQRLAAAPWFREQFTGFGPGGSTPDGAAVRYMAIRLMRRK